MQHFMLLNYLGYVYAINGGKFTTGTKLLDQPENRICNGSSLPELNGYRYNHAAILLHNRYLYVMGGKRTPSIILGKYCGDIESSNDCW